MDSPAVILHEEEKRKQGMFKSVRALRHRRVEDCKLHDKVYGPTWRARRGEP